jgi:hypothetical protein
MICGAIRGAMASLGIEVRCEFYSESDADNHTLIDLELLGVDEGVFT